MKFDRSICFTLIVRISCHRLIRSDTYPARPAPGRAHEMDSSQRLPYVSARRETDDLPSYDDQRQLSRSSRAPNSPPYQEQQFLPPLRTVRYLNQKTLSFAALRD